MKLAGDPKLIRQMGENGYRRLMYKYKNEYMVDTYRKIYMTLAEMSKAAYTEELLSIANNR